MGIKNTLIIRTCKDNLEHSFEWSIFDGDIDGIKKPVKNYCCRIYEDGYIHKTGNGTVEDFKEMLRIIRKHLPELYYHYELSTTIFDGVEKKFTMWIME